MWDPQHLTALKVSTACYRNSFIIIFLRCIHVCNVSFIICVALCAVFCLSLLYYFVLYVYFCVFCLIVVPLLPGKNLVAVQLNNNK
jgi:hypothetical protein